VHFAAAAAWPRGFQTRVLDHFGGRHGRRRAIGQGPSPVLFDPNRDRLVTRAIETCEHRRGRRQRNFVLSRPSAVQHTYAKSFHVRSIQTKKEKGKRLRPERGAKTPSERERGWGPASSDKCGRVFAILEYRE